MLEETVDEEAANGGEVRSGSAFVRGDKAADGCRMLSGLFSGELVAHTISANRQSASLIS